MYHVDCVLIQDIPEAIFLSNEKED